MAIALIGLGEVGRSYAAALRGTGEELALCDTHPSPAATALARDAGLHLHEHFGSWIAAPDWVLSCVTGKQALSVAETMAIHSRPGQILVDMTTASPAEKRQAAEIAHGAGMHYVDVAIMGSVAMMGAQTPLLAAGPHANEFCALIARAGGRAVTLRDGKPGDAIALKIMRSIYTKGLEALAVELLLYAEQVGARDRLFEQLSDLEQMPLRSLLEGLVRTHVIHAGRRAHEVRDASAEMTANGQASLVLPGVEQRFERTVATLGTITTPIAEISIEKALALLAGKAR